MSTFVSTEQASERVGIMRKPIILTENFENLTMLFVDTSVLSLKQGKWGFGDSDHERKKGKQN